MKKSLALVASSLLALAACSGTATVSADDVEQQISDQLAAEVGTAPDSVTCPGELAAEVGTSMTCELTAGEDTLPVTVTVTSVEGSTVNFDIQVSETGS
jgi:hypothetical protein